MLDSWKNIDISDPSSWPTSFKIFGAFVIACGIIGATFHFIVRDKMQVLLNAEQKEEALKKDFLEKKALAINLDAYKAQMVEAENMFSVLKEQLPSETEIPDLLVDVTQKGLSSGLVFEQFEPRNEITNGFYKEKPVRIEVSGSYHELANFVSEVAALPRIVNVNDFEIIAEEVNQQNGSIPTSNLEKADLKMKATIRTYYYQEDQ